MSKKTTFLTIAQGIITLTLLLLIIDYYNIPSQLISVVAAFPTQIVILVIASAVCLVGLQISKYEIKNLFLLYHISHLKDIFN